MAEGLLGGVLGGGDDKPESETGESAAGAEAFAAAVAAIASRQDPGVARHTEEFLQEQTELLRVQRMHLKAEHQLRLVHLSGQNRESALRRAGIRIRIAFQLFVAIVAAFIGAGVILLVHDAVRSRRVVIEPFHAPPALAQRGIDGSVLAAALLDQLTDLQDATRSSSAALGVTGAWSATIRLDVPETGISIAEISRLLRERLGHDVHIDGDLVETSTGELALTVRGNGVPPKSFTAPGKDLDKLTAAAAGYVYSKSQPARWATYLTNIGDYKGAIEFCRTEVAGADPVTRADLLNTWATSLQNVGGTAQEALVLFREAVQLQPKLWRSYNNIMNAYMMLGQEEQAWRAGETMIAEAGGRPGQALELYYQNWDYLTWNLRAWLEETLADATAHAGAGTGATSAGPAIADIYMRLHDSNAVELALKTTKEDPNDPTIAALAHFVHGRLAADAGDAERAASELEAFGVAFSDPVISSNYPGYQCWIAPAEEAAKHPAKADAILQSAGNFVDCYRFRADILDSRGDWSGAQKAYADAVALAPDLPAAYYSWGLALVRHGDLADAAAKLKQASQFGPQWADPLKAWGDLLMRQGAVRQALAKYDEALKWAPNWAALKQARDAAAKPAR